MQYYYCHNHNFFPDPHSRDPKELPIEFSAYENVCLTSRFQPLEGIASQIKKRTGLQHKF